MVSLSSALGGRLENTVTENTFALICQDQVQYNAKLEAAEQLGVKIVKRDWIDWLIVHVLMVRSLHPRNSSWKSMNTCLSIRRNRATK